MALTLVMQELVTVQIDQATPARQVTQPEEGWADLGPYQDFILFTYISAQGSQAGGIAEGTMYFEAAALKEDAFFQAFSLTTVAANAVPSYWSNPNNTFCHLSGGTSPFMRYLRWRIVGPAAHGVATWTFRVVLCVNPAPK